MGTIHFYIADPCVYTQYSRSNISSSTHIGGTGVNLKWVKGSKSGRDSGRPTFPLQPVTSELEGNASKEGPDGDAINTMARTNRVTSLLLCSKGKKKILPSQIWWWVVIATTYLFFSESEKNRHFQPSSGSQQESVFPARNNRKT